MIRMDLRERSYQIYVENGGLDRVGAVASRLNWMGHVAVITDANVAALYAERVMQSLEDNAFSASLHIIPAGEGSKACRVIDYLCNELAKAGVDRHGAIVALGGGVVGDLTGFVASIYYRGVPFMQVPTTATAQIDSSVGGKTAVNIAAGKNLVGTFYQPQAVVMDPVVLSTLPTRVLAEGLAEAVKHAAIKDASMLPALTQLGDELGIGFSLQTYEQLPELIAKNVSIKARIVEADEHETKGLRALLNFGHTIGHGIEAARPYGEILHGEAVALGMRAALILSQKYSTLTKRDAEKINKALDALGLPAKLPASVSPETVMGKLAKDKKFVHGEIRFVLLRAAGDAFVSSEVSLDAIKQVVLELQ